MIAARPDAPWWARAYSDQMSPALCFTFTVAPLPAYVAMGVPPWTAVTITGLVLIAVPLVCLLWRRVVLAEVGTRRFAHGWAARADLLYRGLCQAGLPVTANEVWDDLAFASTNAHLREAARLEDAAKKVIEQCRLARASHDRIVAAEQAMLDLARELKRLG